MTSWFAYVGDIEWPTPVENSVKKIAPRNI